MRLTLTALGLELDITFGLASGDEESAQDPRGDVLTTAVTAQPLGFGEADCAPHFFDPSEGDEDRHERLNAVLDDYELKAHACPA